NAIQEVEEVHVVTGEYDLVVKVRARDTEHLQQLLVGRIHKVTGIARSATEVCMTSPIERLGPFVSPPAAPSPADPPRGRDAW
ncbi:MAG TPA: Lrp/AsnC ligand binding domain-containing protein, partial [Thermoanaerobaculaceae bacterium]|nr:Lrp/AsnC ligand binding domain-containing protein [Thermoanaerobaculaceae bacterium]